MLSRRFAGLHGCRIVRRFVWYHGREQAPERAQVRLYSFHDAALDFLNPFTEASRLGSPKSFHPRSLCYTVATKVSMSC